MPEHSYPATSSVERVLRRSASESSKTGLLDLGFSSPPGPSETFVPSSLRGPKETGHPVVNKWSDEICPDAIPGCVWWPEVG